MEATVAQTKDANPTVESTKDTQPLTEEENWSIWAANLPAHMEAAPFTSDRARHGLKQDWLETTEPKWGLGWAKDVRHKMAGTRAVPLKDAGVGRLTMPKKPKPPVSEEDRLYALKIETDVQNPPMSSLPPPKAIAEAKAKAAGWRRLETGKPSAGRPRTIRLPRQPRRKPERFGSPPICRDRLQNSCRSCLRASSSTGTSSRCAKGTSAPTQTKRRAAAYCPTSTRMGRSSS